MGKLEKTLPLPSDRRTLDFECSLEALYWDLDLIARAYSQPCVFMWMLASLLLAVQAALSRNFLFHVEPRKSKSGRTFTSFPQGILKGTWKGEITRRLPETTRETTNRRWSERLHWVDQVTLFCNNIENWTFRQSIFLESVFYLFFSSHAEDLDPEEGEGDVDSQLSGQQGGEQWWWMVMVNNDDGVRTFYLFKKFLFFPFFFFSFQCLRRDSSCFRRAGLGPKLN